MRTISNTNTRRVIKEEKKIMKMRLNEKNKEIRQVRRLGGWEKKSRDIESRLSPDMRKRYRTLKNREIARVWDIEKRKKLERIETIKPKTPDTYENVMIGDHCLIDRYGNPDIKPAVYGGIIPSSNM